MKTGMDMVNTWLPKTCTVSKVNRLTEDTASFTMLPDDGSEVVFEPGQFNMIYIFGIGEIPISISGGGSDNYHHTVRDGNAEGGSGHNEKKIADGRAAIQTFYTHNPQLISKATVDLQR